MIFTLLCITVCLIYDVVGLVSISAVIVDSTLSLHLVDAILNARAHLQHREPIFVITSPNNYFYFDQKRWKVANVHVLRAVSMPASLRAYSDLLVSCDFWKHFQTEYVLVFQSDSRFCSTSPHDLQDFAAYGYPMIGAPWDAAKNYGTIQLASSDVGNGGFSLRQRSAMLASCIEGPDFSRALQNEDMHFASYFAKHSSDWKTCPRFIAEQFAVEGYYANNGSVPLAVHKSYLYIDQKNPFYQHCPEAELLRRVHP